RVLDVRHHRVRDSDYRGGADAVWIEHGHLTDGRAGTAGRDALAIDLDRHVALDDQIDILVGGVLLEQSLAGGKLFDLGLFGNLARQGCMVADDVMRFESSGQPLFAFNTIEEIDFAHDVVSYTRNAQIKSGTRGRE